jgi:hypothetical protein
MKEGCYNVFLTEYEILALIKLDLMLWYDLNCYKERWETFMNRILIIKVLSC